MRRDSKHQRGDSHARKPARGRKTSSSPLLRKCRECGHELPTAVQATFAVCRRCSNESPGAVLGGEGGISLSFGRATSFGPLTPSDGAYDLD